MPPSGMEMMLHSFGLGEIIEAAKKLASEQTIEKIVQFADRLETLDVEQINARLARIEERLGIEPGSDTTIEGSVIKVELSPTEPLAEDRANRRSGSSSSTRRRSNSHNSGTNV